MGNPTIRYSVALIALVLLASQSACTSLSHSSYRQVIRIEGPNPGDSVYINGERQGEAPGFFEVRRGFADGREADFARGTVRTRLPLETSPSANSLVAQRASLTATIAQRSGAASAHERPARWNTGAAVADSTDGTRAIDEFIAYAPLIRANASDVAQGAAKMVLVGSSSVTTRVELSPEHGLTDTLRLDACSTLAQVRDRVVAVGGRRATHVDMGEVDGNR